MKKRKFSIRLCTMVIGVSLFMQIPVFASTGKLTGTNVRLRRSASTEAEIIDLLAENDVVEILSKEGDWYKVSINGKTGYVSQSYISTNENVEGNNSEGTNNENTQNNQNNGAQTEQNNGDVNNNGEINNNQVSEENQTQNNNINETNNNVTPNNVYKMADNTNLNILPVVTSEYIGEVKKDEEVTLISNAGLWAYIKTENSNGWVRIDKISTENVSDKNGENANNNENTKTTEENNNVTNNETTNNQAVNNEETNNQTTNNQTTNNETTNNETANNQTTNNQTANNQTTNNQTTNTYTPKTMYAKVESANVRGQANTSSEAVEYVVINQEVKVIGEENGWYKVEVNGTTGYIRSDLLSNQKTEVSSRSNTIDRASAVKQNNVIVEAQDNSNVPVSSTGVTGNDIAAYAKQFVGCKYVYGAAGPNSFDCSGLTMYVYKHFGYSLSHSARAQSTQGKPVTDALQPGDILVFSNDGKTVGHVGIYIGNDQFVHASDSTTGVIISRLSDSWNKSKYWGARRLL